MAADMFAKGALRPFAHRGLHGPCGPDGRELPENSLGAFSAAIAAGYGIELDVQPSAEGTPMVFHDAGLGRMTGRSGLIGQTAAADLGKMLLAGSKETIPTLADALDLIAGSTPLLIELKDQSGCNAGDTSGLAEAVCALLADYAGPVAIMSFNPDLTAKAKNTRPDIPAGLIGCAYEASDWPHLPSAQRASLARLEAFDSIAADFISHDWHDLANPAVQALKKRGSPVLCWTIKSAASARTALAAGADAITFEDFLP